MTRKEIVDAPVANTVDADAIREKIKSNHFISQFSKLGTKLLEDTEKPNLITLAQFEPFIPLFNADRKRMEEDEGYRTWADNLYKRYIRELGINLYQPTIVIRSKEDPEELYFLNRVFTRIKSDVVDGNSHKDKVPPIISKTASTTRDQAILEASIMDLVDANKTPEQKEFFARMKIESAIIQKNFVERNMSPEKRAELMGNAPPEIAPAPGTTLSTDGMQFTLDDDD